MPSTRTKATCNLGWRDISRQISDLWSQGRDKAALRLCLDAADRFETYAPVFRDLATAYRKIGQYDRAAEALERARANGMPEARYTAQMAALHWAAGDMTHFLQYAEALQAEPDLQTTPLLRQLARAYIATGALEKAEETAERLLRRAPSPDAVKLKYEAILKRYGAPDWEAAFETRLSGCTNLDEVQPALVMMVQICDRRSERLLRLVQGALDTWPEDAKLRALGQTLGLVQAPPIGPEVPGSGALAAKLELARQALADCEAPQEPPLPSIIPAFAAQLTSERLRRGLLRVTNEDILISPRAPGGELAIVCTGLLDRTSLPLEVIDAYLSAAGRSAIYLRDFNRLLFCNGVQSLGPDFDSTIAGLRGVIDGIGGITRVTTIGFSAGGIGAINFGLALRADRILCFSTPTTIVQPFLDNIKDHRGRLVLARLNKFVPPDLLDPRRRIMAQDNPTRIDLVYGQAMRLDRAHAERLRGFPGVTLYGLDGYAAHNSLNELILRDAFLDTLRGHTERLDALSVTQTAPQ